MEVKVVDSMDPNKKEYKGQTVTYHCMKGKWVIGVKCLLMLGCKQI